MRIVHSLWSKPLLKNRWFLEGQFAPSIWLYALSFTYAKLLTDKVVLYTDDKGLDLLGVIPYDEINLALNDLKNEHQKFWALGKIIAIEKESLGSIHIDGDVFLKSKAILPALRFKDEDVVCQMIEAGHLFETGYKYQLPFFNNVFKNAQITGYGYVDYAYNCGLLGFNNVKLKDEFTSNFKYMVDYAKQDEGIMFKMDGKYEPNVILEQYYLASLCESSKYKAKFILDPVRVDKVN